MYTIAYIFAKAKYMQTNVLKYDSYFLQKKIRLKKYTNDEYSK